MSGQGGKTTARYSDKPEPPRARPYLVVVRDGRHDGRVYQLQPSNPLVAGRLEECDLIVPPEDDSVSRRHAEIELLPNGRVMLRDLGATNGIFLDGLAIEGEVEVPNHGRFRLGSRASYRIDWLTEDEALQQERGFVNALTGCLSREAFDADLADLRARQRQSKGWLGMIILDIDHFGAFNKEHGMPVGDLVLQAVAGCLREEAGRLGVYAYRLGGEEFALLLPDMEIGVASEHAEKLRRDLEKLTVEHEGQELRVTGSFGCGEFHASDEVLADRELLRRADQCLRKAKQDGRNRVDPPPQAPTKTWRKPSSLSADEESAEA